MLKFILYLGGSIMQYFGQNYMQMAGRPNQYVQMATMHQEQLEEMYPTTYNIVQSAVQNTCDMLVNTHGQMYTPNRKQLESMIDNVYNNVEKDVEAATNEGPTQGERQFQGGGRRLLRDFIGALIISNLIGRRRPQYFGTPGFYGGGYGGFGGYPYYPY
jgi:hypothetical protein